MLYTIKCILCNEKKSKVCDLKKYQQKMLFSCLKQVRVILMEKMCFLLQAQSLFSSLKQILHLNVHSIYFLFCCFDYFEIFRDDVINVNIVNKIN